MKTMNDPDLLKRVEQWIADDVDPETQAELRALLARGAGAAADLADRFAGALEFGTAGLRGLLGGGPNRMNRAVVLRTSHGLAAYLVAAVDGAPARGVAIGYDGRKWSRELAEDTACVLASHGIKAHLFDDFAPTPLTAFAVGRLGAAAGVMVTASHNPPEYNGYKVYWGNAAQIIPPIDVAIAAEIAKAPAARAVPRMPIDRARAEGLVVSVPAAVLEDYLARVRALAVHPGGDRAFPIVYTPMHGVGGKVARRAFDEAGFTSVAFVREQEEPDARFPTVAFPNPEEKGAMDLSFALARKNQAALILANDPDADRLAVAVPYAASPTGYLQLTGNQVGVLLGHYLLTESKDQAPQGKGRLVIASLVSSPLLGVIANELGVDYDETLTGFKWIANKAMEREARGGRFVFGYEEALGYTVGDVVRDKDGISAAVVMAELVAWLRGRGETLVGRLEAIHRHFGLFVSSQVNITRPGASGVHEIRAIMDRLRGAQPRRFGAHDVAVIRDYDASTATHVPGGRVEPIAMPRSNVLAFELAGGSRIIARPSGTEPKIKFYFDVREPMRNGEPLAEAEARANATMTELQKIFVAIATGEGEQGNRA
jgi:phosphomannomutase